MSDVITDIRDGVLELTLDRARKKNALTGAMYGALCEGLAKAKGDPAVRAVVFSANGETFCGGNDVNDFMAGFSGDVPPPLRFIHALVDFDKPMVAAVQGPAVGIGTTMLLHCDLVYASEAARLHVPFVSLGLVPEAGSSLLLPRRVGHAVAAEMILTGAPVDARRAKELGLVNEVIADPRALARLKARELARQPPQALKMSRALLRGDPKELSARIAEESAQFAACLMGPEAREAFTAFLERRAPDFTKVA
jgi:enoyl-CoA hydratase/carnithine racemase